MAKDTRKPAKSKPAKSKDTPLNVKTASPFVLASQHGERGFFPVVGIGASAGGLEAFTRLLQKLPADTGMAIVLIQHLDPKHESILTSLLSRASRMPVLEVSNQMRVQPNHVYVIPPNTSMRIVD